MLDFSRMSGRDPIGVLEIDMMFGRTKLGSNPRHI